ncbi:MAG: hypothetical protein PHW52_03130, partial [Candidatus Pacebacteria bacterium]|nr:hypothetical protein [Candidatus Paceibacterota bacterium]
YPIQSDSLFSFTLFFSLLFLAMNVFDDEKERIRAYKFFSFGALSLVFVYLFQIGIGSTKGIEMILPNSEESAIIFSLGLVYMIFNIFKGFNLKEKKSTMKMILWIVFATVFISMIYLMGIKLAWLLSAFGSFFVFWRFMKKRKYDINSPEPFIAFILIIFFVANFLLPLNSLPILKPLFSAEPAPTFSQSYDIVSKSLSTNLTTAAFGTGPASFPYNFSLNKDDSFQDKDIVFTHPYSAFLLILNDFGIVGALAFLSLVIYFLYYTLKLLMKQRNEERDSDEILFISPLFMLFYSLFFYRFSFLIMAIFFLFLGLWISSREYGKRDCLDPKFGKVIFSLLFVGLLVNAYYFYFQYSAEVKYQEAVIASEKKEDLDVVISKIEKADDYFVNNDRLIALSNLYLAKGANIYNEYLNEFTEKSGDTTKKDQALKFIDKAKEYAEKATVYDSRDYRSWHNLAYVYMNIENVSGDKNADVIENYKKAEELAPSNYGIYLAHAQKLENDGDLLGALQLYKKAYELNPDYEGLKGFIDAIENELNGVDTNNTNNQTVNGK